MSRLEAPDLDTLSTSQREVYDTISSGPRGGVRGPLAVWLWRAELAKNAQALGQYCRYDSSLPPQLSELAILVTARHWSSEYEWQAHKKIALDAGLSAEVVEAIRVGKVPSITAVSHQAVYQFSTELLTNRRVSQSTYDAAVEALGQEAVVDLVGVLGYYGIVSMTINVFEIDSPGPDELVPLN